jgi:hypothetical protein
VLLQDPAAAAARAQTPAPFPIRLSDALAMGLRVLAEVTPGLADLAEQGAVIPVTRETLAATLSETLAARAQRTDPQPPARQPHPVFTRARHGEHAWVLDPADAANIAAAVQTLRAEPQRAAVLAVGAGRFYQQSLQADPDTLFDFLLEQVARDAKPNGSSATASLIKSRPESQGIAC